jgi:uncharacterized membrane protein
MKKKLLIFIGILVVALGIFIYYEFFFVFGKGVKTGNLNQIVYKGYIFKTYEGRLILPGLRSKNPGMLESNEFEFSVADKNVAEKMMTLDGETLRLHYKEYKRMLPWRGNSKYVVDSMEILKSSTPIEIPTGTLF